MTRCLAVASVLVLVGVCGAGCGESGSGALSEDECRKLVNQISTVSFAELSPADRAQAEGTPEEVEASVQECVTEQNWTRAGYECVMQATTLAELTACARQGS